MSITFRNQEFRNWGDYFHRLFSKDGMFHEPEIEHKNQTLIETYRYKDGNRKTKIIIAYLDDFKKLIYYNVINPLTPGYTSFWKYNIQYFEEGQYADPPKQGKPGLSFELLNLQNIDKELRIGLAKRELQYYKKGKLIKSKIEFNDEWNWSPYITRFKKRGILSSLFSGKESDEEFDVKTVEIEKIFINSDT